MARCHRSDLISNVGPELRLCQGLQSSPTLPWACPGEECFVNIRIYRELKDGALGRGPGDGMTIISNLFSENIWAMGTNNLSLSYRKRRKGGIGMCARIFLKYPVNHEPKLYTWGKRGIAILTKHSLENNPHTFCVLGQPQRDFWQRFMGD